MAQSQLPGGLYIDDTGSGSYQTPGGIYLNALSGSSGVTIAGLVGTATADGVLATVTQGGSTSISCAVGSAAASGATGAVNTYMVSDSIINNTHTGVAPGITVNWTWWPAGRVGSMGVIVPTEGVGVTGSDGRFVTPLAVAAGVLMLAERVSGATTDRVFYQAFS